MPQIVKVVNKAKTDMNKRKANITVITDASKARRLGAVKDQ